MSFGPVFIAVVVAFGLIVSAFLINGTRPRMATDQPSATLVRATASAPNATRASSIRSSTSTRAPSRSVFRACRS
jgi:hypothetical protein